MTRRGLCIGINDYPGTGSDLRGCVNDAKDWRAALDERGFDTEALLDSDATKKNMQEAFAKLVADTARDDVGVITYSGHGSWKLDDSGDEPDGRDELLCPHDVARGNFYSDDELFDLFAERERGSRVVMISDSCHSGTVAKMAPVGDEDDTVERIRFLPPENFLSDDDLRGARTIGRPKVFSRSRSTALLLAGCQDTEYSYDASFSGRPNGAFTYVALRALKKLGADDTYSDWFAAIRKQLPSANHPQTPNMQGTTSQRRWKVFQ
jgi:metacaspase-1